MTAIDKIGLEITTKCNLTCAHCMLSCQPSKWESLNPLIMENLLDGLSKCGIRFLAITGGEPLEEEYSVRSILSRTKDLGIKTNLVSNASWVQNPEKAAAIMDTFAELELNALEISFDYFHNQFVSFATIKRLISMAKARNIPVSIMCGLTRQRGNLGIIRSLSSLPTAVEYFPILPYGRGEKLHRKYLVPNLIDQSMCVQARRPFVLANGQVILCCGIAVFADLPSFSNSAAVLGNLHLQKIEMIVNNSVSIRNIFANHSIDTLMRAAGLKEISLESVKGSGKCNICYSILSNSERMSRMLNTLQSNHSQFKQSKKNKISQDSKVPYRLPPFGKQIQLKTPAVLAENVLENWNKDKEELQTSFNLLAYVDSDGLVSYRFVSETISIFLKEMLDGKVVLLEDPEGEFSIKNVNDVKEYFRRRSLLIAFEKGALLIAGEK